MNPRFLWAIALGFGVGTATGAALAAGIAFEQSDVARLTGALIGSIIAVSGAVSLYYLKEYNDKKGRIEDFKDLLIGLQVYSNNCAKRFRGELGNVSPQSSLIGADVMWKRSLRFGSKYEFEVYAIGHAHHMLTVADHDFSDWLEQSEFSAEQNELVCHLMDLRVGVVDDAIAELNAKNPRKSK